MDRWIDIEKKSYIARLEGRGCVNGLVHAEGPGKYGCKDVGGMNEKLHDGSKSHPISVGSSLG